MSESTPKDSPERFHLAIWGINYSPEVTGIGPYNTLLAEFARRRGHPVTVVTSFPYYPAWQKDPVDRRFLFRKDLINGVSVHRTWHYVPRKVSALRRILHEATFVATSFIRILTLKRPDFLFVVSPPLALGFAAWVYRLLRRVPYAFHVQDLQPDAAASLGMIKPGRFVRALYWLESFSYRKANLVSGISPGMLEAFRSKGVAESKLVYFPNPVVLPETVGGSPVRKGAFRETHQVPENTFLVVYSGNVGVKQGLDTVVRAIRLLDHTVDLLLLICGEGAAKTALQELVGDCPKIRFLPLLSSDLYQQMLTDADLSLVSQQANSGAAFFPSKLLSLFASQTPVLAIADTESVVSEVILTHDAGFLCQPSDPALLAEKLFDLKDQTAELKKRAANGYHFIQQFEVSKVLPNFLDRLALSARRRNRTPDDKG
ncbi:MAG: WcaI family glycosyltransferase [Puniceicoccaceae bacterium]